MGLIPLHSLYSVLFSYALQKKLKCADKIKRMYLKADQQYILLSLQGHTWPYFLASGSWEGTKSLRSCWDYRRKQSIGGEVSSRLRSRSSWVRRRDGVLNEECRYSTGQGDHLCSRRWSRAQKTRAWVRRLLKRRTNETYYWPGRLKMPCVWIFNLEPTNIILKKECECAIICARRVIVLSHCNAQNANVPECAPARAWPSSNSDVLIGGYDSSRRL